MKIDQFRILLVDDSPENIATLGSSLTEYKRLVALSGKKALSILESDKLPDLILLDIEMPEMDGFEVCRQIRLNEAYKNIPIIFLTGKTDPESKLKGFELGGQDFITKPFDKNELLARVKTHLELKFQKEQLEIRVQERTLQLNVANEKLNKLNTELKNIDLSKTAFINNSINELKTPIRDLINAFDLLKDHIESKQLSEIIYNVENSLVKFDSFSEDAKLYSILVTNKSKFKKEEIVFLEMIEYVMVDLELLLLEKEIQFESEILSDDIMIIGDSNLLHRLLKKILRTIVEGLDLKALLELRLTQTNENVVLELFSKDLQTSSFNKVVDNKLDMSSIILNKIMFLHQIKIEYEDNSVKINFPVNR